MDKLSAIAPESKIVIEDDQKCLIVDGKHVFLTRSEFNIVAYLAARPFVVRSREQILDHVYGNAGMGERSIDSLVKRTRLKLKPFDVSPIHTRHGFGYVWIS